MLVELGADYSEARPTPQQLLDAGVKHVGRYLAPEGDGREIEADEYNALIAAGINVWFVREGAATGMRGGYAKGVTDAQIAVANLQRIGAPSNSIVYAAADWDVQESELGVCDAYMRGFASILGQNLVGIYGGMYYLNHCRANNLAVAFWKAAATSWDHGETGPVDIEQTTDTPPVPGTDHDNVYTTDPLPITESATMFIFSYKGWWGIAVPTGNATKPLHAVVLGAQDTHAGFPVVNYNWSNAYAQLWDLLDNQGNVPAP